MVNELTTTSSKQRIELFCKDIADFMVLHCGAQIGCGASVVSSDVMEDRWEELQDSFKAIPNKTHQVNDIWKNLSSLMSKHFVTKKMINAEQLAFNTQSKFQK